MIATVRQAIQDRLLPGLAGLVLLLFAGVWLWIGLKVVFFDSTATNPTLSFSDAQVAIAGILASAVGAGTASVLGIEIQKFSGEHSFSARVGKAATGAALLTVGIGLYAAIGVFVLIVWFFRSDAAPEMVGTFGTGVLGWLVGAFAAVFRAETS
jgi:hypothetical protein